MARVRLFVYGSLKRGGRHHDQLAGALFLGEASTLPGYRLEPLGEYLALVSLPPAPETETETEPKTESAAAQPPAKAKPHPQPTAAQPPAKAKAQPKPEHATDPPQPQAKAKPHPQPTAAQPPAKAKAQPKPEHATDPPHPQPTAAQPPAKAKAQPKPEHATDEETAAAAAVSGELYEVDESKLSVLDTFEGDAYERGNVRLAGLPFEKPGLALAYFRKAR